MCFTIFFFNYIFSFFFFFNLICMLKKSQSWVCLQLQNQPRSSGLSLPSTASTQTAEESRCCCYRSGHAAWPLTSRQQALTGGRIWLIILISVGNKNRVFCFNRRRVADDVVSVAEDKPQGAFPGNGIIAYRGGEEVGGGKKKKEKTFVLCT